MEQTLKTVLAYALMLVLQGVVFDRMTLWDLAAPSAYLVLAFFWPLRFSLAWEYAAAFCMGMIMGLFSKPIGAHALGLLVVAALRRRWLAALNPNLGEKGVAEIALEKMSLRSWIVYMSPLTLAYELIMAVAGDLSLSPKTMLKALFATLYSLVVCLMIAVVFVRK
ncbi:MAG: hypothetical protein RMM53_04100 [Bacteroidia bacterium]|nr:hypothetical protein [Bacteroidia bacterium]MDW8333379.1 hypothetical protein [Bacteroidia bacterium]